MKRLKYLSRWGNLPIVNRIRYFMLVLFLYATISGVACGVTTLSLAQDIIAEPAEHVLGIKPIKVSAELACYRFVSDEKIPFALGLAESSDEIFTLRGPFMGAGVSTLASFDPSEGIYKSEIEEGYARSYGLVRMPMAVIWSVKGHTLNLRQLSDEASTSIVVNDGEPIEHILAGSWEGNQVIDLHQDGKLRVIDIRTGDIALSIETDLNVTCAAVHSNRLIFAGRPKLDEAHNAPNELSYISVLQSWDIATGKKLAGQILGYHVACVEFSEDGKWIACAGGLSFFQKWQLGSGQLDVLRRDLSGWSRRYSAPAYIKVARFVDKQRMVIGLENGWGYFVDFRKGKRMAKVKLHEGAVQDIAVKENNVFSCGFDGTLAIWQFNTKQ